MAQNRLHRNVIVQRRGDRYVISKGAWNEAIHSVLWFRRRALRWYRLRDDDILSYHAHKDALVEFDSWFKKSRLAERALASSAKFMGRGKEGCARAQSPAASPHCEGSCVR